MSAKNIIRFNFWNFYNIFLKKKKKIYIINYEIEKWNYYDNIEHIINNASEINNKLSRNGKKINQMNSVVHNYNLLIVKIILK